MFPRRPDRKPHPPGRRYPFILALHGFDAAERTPKRAALTWGIDYNLADAYGTLNEETLTLAHYKGAVTSAQLKSIHQEVQNKKSSGALTATAFTPRFVSEDSVFVADFKGSPSKLTIEQYAQWLANDFEKAVRENFPGAAKKAASTAISGVTLGGWIALEVGLRFPDHFALISAIQPALEEPHSQEKIEKLTLLAVEGIKGGSFPEIHLVTSEQDPAFKQVELFSKSLRENKIPHSLFKLKGKRDLRFKRGAAAIELLRTAEQYLPMETVQTRKRASAKKPKKLAGSASKR